MKMYAIYDKGTNEFTAPFQATNDYAAMRVFTLYPECAKFPADFDLYHIGEYVVTAAIIGVGDDVDVRSPFKALSSARPVQPVQREDYQREDL